MALPLVGVGLLYRKGYFRQTIDADGHQEHAYPDFDLNRLPVLRVLDRIGDPLYVPVELPGRAIQVAVWMLQVGRVPVLLLDTDHARNDEADRPITHILYVRGREMRLHQELVLGVGGVRALRALGHRPGGLAPQRGPLGVPARRAGPRARRAGQVRWRTPGRRSSGRASSRSTRRSRPATSASTPTWCGASPGRSARATGAPGTGGVPIDEVLALGRGVDGDAGQFDMTAFSLRLANGANAVSKLHAETANDTWQGILGGRAILGVTNGVHTPTWVGPPAARAPGALPRRRPRRPGRPVRRRALLGARRDASPTTSSGRRTCTRSSSWPPSPASGCVAQLARHGESPATLTELEHALDPETLTIGFARRFATYKRAALIFTDIDRLARLVHDAQRPVQFVFAGKAHPADRPGQQVIQEIFARSRSPELRGRVFVLEDYDMRVAKLLVRGVDVWLNNPRRPLEASGTSGMKASANGIVNLSVLDGWWDEGWTGDNGWAIGGRETNPDEGAQDWADALDLYRILEDEVVPRYYDRGCGRPAAGLARAR